MRLTAILLLAGVLQVSARTNAQTVTYTGKSVPLTEVFSVIKKQTGYLFFYRKEDLSTTVPVTLQLKEVPLRSALEQALADQPLIFQIQGNTIFITLKPPPAPTTTIEIIDPAATVNGRVTDSLGTPLSGASIMIRGSKRGTTTDARGDFELKGIPDNPTLIISFTGYTTKEYKVRDYSDKIFIIMSRSNSPLDDVQVVAYGTNTRRFNVGSVSVVTSEEIQKQPVTNLLLTLQGRVPGLTVDPTSGIPGSRVNTQIRGQNSLISILGNNSVDEPLYIVDGIPFASQNKNLSGFLSTFSGSINSDPTTAGITGLNAINPADIESISVLKDADATSIYGSQGANGVIVITTKKGKSGATSLNLRVNTGPNKIGRQLEMLNTPDYLAMRRKAMANDGITDPSIDPDYFVDVLVYDSTKYTNWPKKFFGGTSNTTDAYANISGGTQYTTFMVSTGYSRSVYNFPGDFADQRLSLHSGVHHASLNRRFTIDFGSDFSYNTNNSSSQPGIAQALALPPNHPEMIDEAGNLVWSYKGVKITDQMMAYLKRPYQLQSYSTNNSLRLSYQVLRGLNVGVGLGYSMVMTKEFGANPLGTQDPTQYPSSSANAGRGDFQTINVEPQIDYRRNIGNGVLSVLAGGTYKKVTNSYQSIEGQGYPDDALLHSIEAAATISGSTNSSIYKYAGAFGRIGYIYDKKYIINLTGRRDGSSNFGPGHQFGNFGSIGLGWIFSEEAGFKRTLPFISYGKLSGNYGTNGSDGVAPYRFQPFWKSGNIYSFPSFQGTRPYFPVNLYNPGYGWASKHALNLSMDLGFFGDRLLTNVTWYRNRTGNQLTSSPLPFQTGFNQVVENFQATLQDQGLEISITSNNIRTKDFLWSTSFNISFNRNKLVAFPNIDKSAYATIYTVGQSTSLVYGFRYKGVNDTTGLFNYYNAKGGVGSTTMKYTRAEFGGDMFPIADPQPRYFGGLGNTLSYKGWNLSFFFNYNKRVARNYLAGVYGGVNPGGQANLPLLLMNSFWEKQGDHALLQRLATGSYGANQNGRDAGRAAQYFGSSSAVWGDGSFIRLKNISISYSLPATALKKVGLKGCNIYINAQNIFTITGYKFGDPETPGQLYAVPIQRTVVGGLSLDF